MKIAFVYDAVYPWVKGGAEKRIYEIGKRLAEKGHDVHLFGVKWWEGNDVIDYEGMVLHGVCKSRDLYVNGKRSISEAMIFSVKLSPHLLKQRFDVIDVSVFPYFSCFTVKAVSILRSTPAFFTWHEVWDDYWYEYMGRIGFFGRIIERIVSRISSNVIAVSEMTKKNLESLGLDGQKIAIVSNGIDLDRILASPPVNETCDILFIGRLIKEKNVDMLLKSMTKIKKKCPAVKLHVIGQGPEKEKLLTLVENYDIPDNTKFFDFMEYEELLGRIKASKVLVLPSSREGFGIVVVEAFACGTPVVTVKAKRNAAQYLINSSCGCVVELEPDAIADSIKKILQNNSIHQDMSRAAVEKSKNYNWNNIVPKLLYTYGELK
ncbi:glycosyltransferase family 4 protein [Methanolobus sediminis]|uniref:Glycosyltransferase family 4 protein n=1 Tax=Methanolobus sediminis TaxID=3072978 RepID=A0AA51YID0_9EURY|nr:glycosyltransferase family 4 protein [Methanolobus sediminis]WMW24385.1 glycosyltransferase family 4 protein [Methanolobus sediminis]